MAAIANYLLQQVIIRAQGPHSILKEAIGRDWKGKLSPLATVFLSRYLSKALRMPSASLWKLFWPDASSTNCRSG